MLYYATDIDSIQHSFRSIENFLLVDILNVKQLKKLHILAHSLGNRAIVNSLSKLARDIKILNIYNGDLDRHHKQREKLGEIIMMAADVDAVFLREFLIVDSTHLYGLTNRLNTSIPGITIYINHNDVALAISTTIRMGTARVGRLLSNIEVLSDIGQNNKIMMIDASVLKNILSINHTYYLKKQLARDLRILLNRTTKNKRKRNIEEINENLKGKQIKYYKLF